MARDLSSQQSSKRVRAVTVRALLGRVNRALAVDGKELKRTRGAPAVAALGAYIIVDGNAVVSDHVDIERLARKLGALEAYEHLLDEE